MPDTVVLTLYSIAYPDITNPIRVDVSTQANPTAIIDSITDTKTGHPARIWSFPGLPRTNYQVVMNEIDASGVPLTQLAFFDVVPNAMEVLVRQDEQLKVGVTPGLVAGKNSIQFNGGLETTNVVLSTLAIKYNQNYSPNTYGVTFGGTVNIGDKIKVDYTYDSRERLVSSLASSNSGNGVTFFTGTLSGTPFATDTLNLTIDVDGAHHVVLSDAGYTTIAALLSNLLSKATAAGLSASVTGNSITITGTTQCAGALYVVNAFGTVPHTGTYTITSTTTVLNDLIASLINGLSVAVPSAVVMNFFDGTYYGFQFGGYTYSTLVTSITKVSSSSTANRPDFRGWNINPERRAGQGTMIRGEEYSWDEVTGWFNLLIQNDVFLPNESFNIDFDPKQSLAGGSTAPPDEPIVVSGFPIRLVTTNATILAEDLGGQIIVEPVGTYMELTLPDITKVISGFPIDILVKSANVSCVKIKPFSTNKLIFDFGANLFMYGGENLRIYMFMRTTGNPEWRVDKMFGNFDKVGRVIYSDNTSQINAVTLNGVVLNNQQYSRLWQYVSSLPSAQLKPYADGITTFYSQLSGSNFRVPDRRKYYARGTNAEMAGTFTRMSMEKHKHIFPYGNHPSALVPPFGGSGFKNKYGMDSHDNDNDYWFTNDGTELSGSSALNTAGVIGTETNPNSYSINQYALI
jgi:hypothetical protein